jgi:hypothetical protein
MRVIRLEAVRGIVKRTFCVGNLLSFGFAISPSVIRVAVGAHCLVCYAIM